MSYLFAKVGKKYETSKFILGNFYLEISIFFLYYDNVNSVDPPQRSRDRRQLAYAHKKRKPFLTSFSPFSPCNPRYRASFFSSAISSSKRSRRVSLESDFILRYISKRSASSSCPALRS